MMDDPFERWRLTPVINVTGTKTGIGASRVAAETRALVDQIMSSFVDMDELQTRAGAVIARITGAEAGCITACSAAAMTQTVAACLTGADLARIEMLPQTDKERRVLLPMSHMVNYGAPVDQAIRLAGAHVVPVGTAATCEEWHLRAALERGAAAAMYVVSHHTVRENELPMDLFIACCQEYEVPAIVDMASEYDLTGPLAMGASAVIYSGHKCLGGVTSGIVAGQTDLVRATYLQHRGIGRTMKAGKESIVGAIAALELWETRDHQAVQVAEEKRVALWSRSLSDIPGMTLARHADWTGNPITRLCMTVDPVVAGLNAWELTARLAARSPQIIVRDDLIEHQEIYLDPCNLTDDEAEHVVVAIREEVARFRADGDGLQLSWSDIKHAREAQILAWRGNWDDS
ncbi:MAG: hypothetical protein OXE84_04335 [Rhodobacteraceae bacterium]|nr:hypothetical protein [Paracoccaceae bacterium]MCY4196093.1 hypothetical protein [Paracoccaceae bacterium]